MLAFRFDDDGTSVDQGLGSNFIEPLAQLGWLRPGAPTGGAAGAERFAFIGAHHTGRMAHPTGMHSQRFTVADTAFDDAGDSVGR